MDKTKQDTVHKEFFEWTKAITIAVVLAILIRVFLFEFVVVEQTSMYPTLEEGEKLCVTKISYLLSEPERGDIVIVKISDTVRYVKRVIACRRDH
jgi:signal peptidase I